MEFRQLEVFAAVAETKSFSKAADALYLSQSTVSTHIKNLEKELHMELFQRSTRVLQLTEGGSTLLFYARRILETKEAALAALDAPTDIFLRLGASTIPSAYLLPHLLSGFRKKCPHIFFEVRQGDSEEIMDRVRDGTAELGLVGNRCKSSHLVFLPFCTDELVIATPLGEHYLSLYKKKAPVETLLREPIILRESGSGTQKAADRYFDSLGIDPSSLQVVARMNDLESIKQLVRDGMGISIFSRLAVQNLQEQGQILLFPLESKVKREFYLVYSRDRAVKPAMQSFIDYILSMRMDSQES